MKKKRIKTISLKPTYQGIFLFLLAIGFILNEITNYNILKIALSFFVLVFIFLSILNLKGPVAKVVYVLTGLSIILLLGKKNVTFNLIEGSLINLPIVTIFILTPLLGIPIKLEDYVSSLRRLLNNYKNNSLAFFMIFLILTHILSVILNIGSISINLHLMKSSNIQSKRLIANALIRGYTSISTWSPFLGIMILVLEQLQLDWFNLLPYTFIFVALSLLVAVVVELNVIKEEDKYLKEIEDISSSLVVNKTIKSDKKKITELITFLFITVILVLLIYRLMNVSFVVSIAFIAVFLPLGFSIYKKRMKYYKKEVINHMVKTLPNLQTEIVLFLIAGIFSHIFVNSPLSNHGITLLNFLFGHSTLLIAIALSSCIIVLSSLGIHPVVMLTIFTTSINPVEIGLSPLYFAILLLGSAGIAQTISPSTAVNNFVSYALNENVYVVAMKWNWIYALTLFIILPIYLNFIGV